MKSKAVISIAIILILSALVFTIGIDNLGLGCITCGGEGFTVDSISATKVISNNVDLASANVLVKITANDGGQSLVGTIDNTDLNTEFTSNPIKLALQYPIKIDMSKVKEQLSFPIANQGTKINQYRLIQYDRPWYKAAECDKTVPGFQACFYYQGLLMVDRAFGLILEPATNIRLGLIENPNVEWSGDITITAKGIPYTKSIGSGVDGTQGTVEFYDFSNNWIGQAKWTSSGVTGQATPNQNNYKAIYTYGKWNIVDYNTFKYYEDNTQLSKFIAATQDSDTRTKECFDESCSNIKAILSQHTNAFTKLLDTNVPLTYRSLSGNSMSYSTNGGMDKGEIIATGDRITIPQINLLLKATQIGIYIPVGKPEIQKPIPTVKFSSGNADTYIVLSVKNIGVAKGTFSATFTESSGTFKSLTVTQPQISLEPGVTGEMSIRIGHGNVGSAIKTGTVTVYDVNFGDSKDTAPVTIEMSEPQACTPGTTKIDDNTKILWKCNAAGTDWDRILECLDSYVTGTTGNYKCASVDGNGNNNGNNRDGTTGSSFEIILKSWLSSPLLIALLIVIALIGISIFKQTKRRKT